MMLFGWLSTKLVLLGFFLLLLLRFVLRWGFMALNSLFSCFYFLNVITYTCKTPLPGLNFLS